MAQYQENFTSKLAWAMPFQRTGDFPLDRSSIFESYADALLYAKGLDANGKPQDSRKLGATSYVGQVIVVYGNDAGSVQEDGSIKYNQEVAAYIIKAVGENAALMKLAQASSTGDLATDVGNLQTALGNLQNRIKAVEDVTKNYKDTDTTYTFSTAATTDGAIKVVTKNPDGNETSQEVQVKGWSTLVGIAGGRTTAYVYQNKDDALYIHDIATKDKYKVGDVIYFTDTAIADEWVSKVLETQSNSSYYTFSKLETEHPDLSGYLTIQAAQNTYATIDVVNNKAETSVVNELSQTVNQHPQDIAGKAAQSDLEALQQTVENIDVTNQITTEIGKLNVTEVGGSGKYIQAIKQVNGKIEATVQAMPNIQSIANEAANTAKNDAIEAAATALDTKVGDIGTGVTIKSYVDAQVAEPAQEISTMKTKISTIESNVGTNSTAIGEINTTVNSHTTRITNVETRIGTAESKIQGIETKIASIEENAERNVIEVIKVNNVALQVDSTDRSVNISAISTDLLTQGTKTLILDCGAAKLK